jgi:hypothetical protein
VLGHQVKRPGQADAGRALLAACYAGGAATACLGEIETAAGAGASPRGLLRWLAMTMTLL